MIMLIHLLGKMKDTIEFNLFLLFGFSAPSAQIENDVIPTPVIAPPKTNTPTNQQRLHRNKSLFVY